MNTRSLKKTIAFISAALIIGTASYACAGHGYHGGGTGNNSRGSGYRTGTHMGDQAGRTGYGAYGGSHMNKGGSHMGGNNQGGYHMNYVSPGGRDGHRGNMTGSGMNFGSRSSEGNQRYQSLPDQSL